MINALDNSIGGDDDNDDLLNINTKSKSSVYSNHRNVPQSAIASPPFTASQASSKPWSEPVSKQPPRLVLPVTSSKVREMNVNYIANLQQKSEYSKNVAETVESFYIPVHCNRLAYGDGYLTAAIKKGMAPIQLNWEAFKSKTDHAQGYEDLKILTKAGGNLKNVFLITFDIVDMISTCQFPMAVYLGYYSNEKKFIPYEGRKVRVNNIAAIDGELDNNYAHEILLPGARGKLRLFTSLPNVNHEWGIKYPWLTDDVQALVKGFHSVPNSNNKFIPILHPVYDWISANKAKLSPFPDKQEMFNEAPFVQVPPDVIQIAVDEVLKIIREEIPTKNLENIHIKFVPFDLEHFPIGDTSKNVVGIRYRSRHVFRERGGP